MAMCPRQRIRRTDLELLQAMRAGVDEAFAELVVRHRQRMVAVARRTLSDPELAEDVVQESLVRAHRALLRDEGPVELGPWLTQVARNASLDESRRRRPTPIDPDRLAALDRAGPEPGQIVEDRARMRALLTDIAALPASQRHALIRREVNGLTHDDVARELGTTRRASISLVQRAKASLRRARDAARADTSPALDSSIK